MKTDTIKVSELEDYLKVRRLERDLAIELTHLKELKELESKKMEKIIPIAKQLNDLRKQPSIMKWELDEEVRKCVNKHGW
jgi:hypothetical protein